MEFITQEEAKIKIREWLSARETDDQIREKLANYGFVDIVITNLLNEIKTKTNNNTNNFNSTINTGTPSVTSETPSQSLTNATNEQTISSQPPTNIQPSNEGESVRGTEKVSMIPDEIKGWSWGGFLWGWIWSIGNDTWIGLLTLVPIIGFIMRIVLGVNGREWAWKNKRWDGVEHFKKIQRRWVIWWLILGLFPLLAFLSVAFLSTINPVEQMNKARDAQSRNNSAELSNAFIRYYARNSKYPWPSSQNSNGVQLININNALWLESVYSADELNNSFRDKLLSQDVIYTLYHNSSDTYVCFNPKSTDGKEKAKTRCITDTKINDTNLCLSNMEQICYPDN